MKKSLSLVLSLLMLLSLVACKGHGDGETGEDKEPETSTASENTDSSRDDKYRDIYSGLRYGIEIPETLPELDKTFYGYAPRDYTDDYLAENRERLNFVPSDTERDVLVRFLEYLDKAEPCEEDGNIKFVWAYSDSFYNGPVDHEISDTVRALIKVPVPVFNGGTCERSDFDATSQFTIENAGFESKGYMTDDPDGIQVKIDASSTGLPSKYFPDDYSETLLFTEENEENGTFTASYGQYNRPDYDAIETYAWQAIIKDNSFWRDHDINRDLKLEVRVKTAKGATLTAEDVEVLKNYFNYINAPCPGDDVWHIA